MNYLKVFIIGFIVSLFAFSSKFAPEAKADDKIKREKRRALNNKETKQKKTASNKKKITHYVAKLPSLTPFVRYRRAKSHDLPDTTLPEKLRLGYRSYSSFMQPMSVQPVLERLGMSDNPVYSDSVALYTQKELGYQLYADFLSVLTFRELSYMEDRPKLSVVVCEDVIFTGEDSSLILVNDEELDLSEEHTQLESDATLEERLKLIENIIPLRATKEVRASIEYFKGRNRGFTLSVLRKQHLYFPLFEKVLAEMGLPDELKYIALIESALNPSIMSHAGALGLWQLMAITADHVGMKNTRNTYIDQRMDPYKATVAACKYFKYLDKLFKGDWETILAAYNCGPGRMQGVQRRAGTKGYYNVYNHLPKETRQYVPRYVAVAYLMNYPEENNLLVKEYAYQFPTDSVLVNQQMDLELLAKELNMCYEDLKALNPELRKGIVPYFVRDYKLCLPANRAKIFRQNEPEILASVRGYGKAHPSSVSERTYANNGKSAEKKANTVLTDTKRKVLYKVKLGDTLNGLAGEFKTNIASIKYWNALASTDIKENQELVIWANTTVPGYKLSAGSTKTTVATASHTAQGTKFHVVRPGDTLWEIANKYPGVSVAQIRQLNGLASDRLKIGQKIIVKNK